MREVLQENRSEPSNRGLMSECRFDGVIETMEKHTKLRCQSCGPEGVEECVLTLRSTACEALWRRHQPMVKLAFALSLVCETREVDVVIEVCERNVSVKYQREG